MEHAARIGLDTLVEAHDAAELARAVALGADPIGINARDLATFAIDRHAQLRLVAQAPRDRVVIAESAIHSRAQGAAAELAGADAVLVGTRADAGAPTRRRSCARSSSRPAGEGLRADARRRRRGRGRGRRRPAAASSSSPRARARRRRCCLSRIRPSSVAVFVGEARGDRRRPRPALRARGRQGARPRRRPPP